MRKMYNLPWGEYFPNGLPKVCNWCEMDSDIHYVTNKDGVLQPVLEDYWLALDFKKGMNIFLYWEFRCRKFHS